jgi:hypothetical protein
MTKIRTTRPKFPKGYVDAPISTLTWGQVSTQLKEARHYWLCTVRPNGRPHVVPRWGVFLDDKFFYDGSPETRHAQNLETNQNTVLHLESGEHAVILEGVSAHAGRPSPELALRLARAIGDKYSALGYSPEANQWDEEGLYVFTPRKCIAWSVFKKDPTKFIFE